MKKSNQKFVYVVFQSIDYEGTGIYGIFDTLLKAKKILKKVGKSEWSVTYSIAKIPLNEYLGNQYNHSVEIDSYDCLP